MRASRLVAAIAITAESIGAPALVMFFGLAAAAGAMQTAQGAPGAARAAVEADGQESGIPADGQDHSRLDQAPSGRGRADRLADARALLSELVAAYGVSGSEGPVRDTVRRLLPGWAAATAHVDSAGNLRLRVGSGAPLVVFVAHLDEIGFSVTAVRDDGLLELEPRGGFYGWLFQGEPALVHTVAGPVPGVFVPPETPRAETGSADTLPLLDLGVRTRGEAEALGVRAGDTATMPKRLVPLAGTRATARSLDDRVGCAAQILALRALDQSRLRHAVEFVWSTQEEVGLRGAELAARDLAPERPVRVHAVDTFVSSDAPLEHPTFAHVPLGSGAVIRAVDQSAVAPPALVDSLSSLAAGLEIPLQVGATSGGNDGSVFTRYGVPDVAIAWPLRYSHSPVEVIDLSDLLALADLIQAITERW